MTNDTAKSPFSTSKKYIAVNLGDWSMGDIPQSHLTALLNLQFSGSDQFSPYDMSGESAYLMLLELKQNLPSE